jgi:hypothetical protein
VDPTSAHLTLEDLQREPTIYLVPECDTEDQAVEYLGESAGTIFEEHLDGWYRVPTVWPTKRDLATFQRWFEFSFHSMIVDLVRRCSGTRRTVTRDKGHHASLNALHFDISDFLIGSNFRAKRG